MHIGDTGLGFMKGSAAPLGPGPVTSISVNSVNTSSSSSINLPSTALTGDLCVLFDSRVSTSTNSSVVPAGYTSLNDVETVTGSPSSVYYRSIISYRVLTADGADTLTGMGGFSGKILYIIRPNKLITTVAIAGKAVAGSLTTVSNQTCASGSGTPPLIVFGKWRIQSTGSIATTPMSPAPDRTDQPVSYDALSSKLYNSSPANVTVQQETHTGSTAFTCLESFYITVV